MGALAENGPCFVNSDSNSTYLNPWSWYDYAPSPSISVAWLNMKHRNNEVNILYIDQPNQVGFSYDTLHNITVNLAASSSEDAETTVVDDFGDHVPEQNATFYVGTSSSHDPRFTANTTMHAAVAIWHFAQTWFEE